MKKIRILLSALLVLGSTQTQGQALDNDNFANARVISGFPTIVSANNFSATEEAEEPDHGGGPGGHSIWFTWTATFSGLASVDVAEAGFDSLLAVYTGSSVSALTLIANDVHSGANERLSTLLFNAVEGIPYRIVVDVYHGLAGDLVLRIASPIHVVMVCNPPGAGSTSTDGIYSVGHRFSLASTPSLPGFAFASWSENGSIVSTDDIYKFVALTDRTITADYATVPVPANDSFSNRVSLFGAPVSVNGTSVGSSKELNEPNHDGYLGGASIWWSWTAPFSGVASFKVNAFTLQPIIALYTGTELATLSLFDAERSTNGGEVHFATLVSAGMTYQIAADSLGNFRGPVSLEIARGVEIVTQANPSNTGMVTGEGLYSVGDYLTVTGFADTPGKVFSNWSEGLNVVSTNIRYSFRASVDRTLVANYSNVSIPANDAFADAFFLSGSASGTNVGASLEKEEPVGDYSDTYNSVWWKWTAPTTGLFFSQTTGAFLSRTFVFAGSELAMLEEESLSFPSSENTQIATIHAIAGRTYAISVRSDMGQTGPFSLRVDSAIEIDVAPNLVFGGSVYLNDYTQRQSFPLGSEVRASAFIPFSVAGYDFLNWTVGGSVVSQSSSFIFNATVSRSLVANFRSIPIPSNDSFANATVLSGSTVFATGTTSGASLESQEPRHDLNATYRTIWWSWTAPASGPVTVDLAGSSIDAALAIYTGTTLKNLVRVAGNYVDQRRKGSNLVPFEATAGTTYKIAVDGTVYGSISLNLKGQSISTPTPTPVQYSAMVRIRPNISGAVTGAGTFSTGSFVTLRAKAKKGTVFVNWTEGRKIIGRKRVLSFVLTGNRAVTANFKRQ